MEKLLIKNTTKEERQEIVNKGLDFASLVNPSEPDTKIFDDYINGEKELDEIYMSKASFENVVDKSKVKKESDLFDIPFDKEDNLDLFKK